MNPRTFLQKFEESAERDRLVDLVYDEMVSFCRENDITEDELSTPALEQLAEGFVERGLGVPTSDETEFVKGRYVSSGDDLDSPMASEYEEVDPELIEELKRLSKENEEYNFAPSAER
jgi:hypothetical protein